MSVYGQETAGMERGDCRRNLDIPRKGSWAAAEYASDCPQGCGALSLVGHNKKRPWMQPVVVFMVFYAINRLVQAPIVFTKEGDFYHGICTYVYATFWALIPPVVAIVLG